MDEGARPLDVLAEPARILSRVLVAHVEPRAGHVVGAQRTQALHRDADSRQAPPFLWLDARICPDHQLIVNAPDDEHDVRNPTSSLSSNLVPPARHEPSRPAALHAKYHVRSVPTPTRDDAEHISD